MALAPYWLITASGTPVDLIFSSFNFPLQVKEAGLIGEDISDLIKKYNFDLSRFQDYFRIFVTITITVIVNVTVTVVKLLLARRIFIQHSDVEETVNKQIEAEKRIWIGI